MNLTSKFILFFIICPIFFDFTTEAVKNLRPFNNNVSAILVFGDSTVDAGNNNYIDTPFIGNFLPYGADLPEHPASGRFCNGRLITDIGASYVGLKEFVPPYLDPTLDIAELLTGVSFASAGTGFDPLTSQISNVISMSKQMDYFKEYKKKLESAIGKTRTADHLKRAGFILSAGSNDFMVNYYTLPVRRKNYSVSQYQQFIMQNFKTFIQNLWDEGARKILVAGLPPMGCLPGMITLHAGDHHGCMDEYSHVAVEYNINLQKELKLMQNKYAHQGARILYLDIYYSLLNLIQGAGKSEFEEVRRGCCGSGYLEIGFLCNKHSSLCSDRSKYLFFDSIHPTEKTYQKIFESALDVVNRLIKD